jgi:hypothetical protein
VTAYFTRTKTKNGIVTTCPALVTVIQVSKGHITPIRPDTRFWVNYDTSFYEACYGRMVKRGVGAGDLVQSDYSDWLAYLRISETLTND